MQREAGRKAPGDRDIFGLGQLFGRRGAPAVEDLYRAIVTQARQPVFYADLGVPDTEDGRFDMIVLHLVLAMRRLRADGEGGRQAAQTLFDTFFRDMDRSLREMGVGDLVVPKRIRRMGEAFYGRAGRYDPALDARDGEALAAGLEANLYGRPTAGEARRLASYALATERRLEQVEYDRLLRGLADWPEP